MTRNKKRTGVALLDKLEENRSRKQEVWVEYPCDGEVVIHPTYTLQLRAVPEAANVEVSFDDGEWLSCRESLGLWWYDWARYEPGEHKVVARIRKDGTGIEISEPRRFTVTIP